jgi:type IV conjugative transfer system protein TraE
MKWRLSQARLHVLIQQRLLLLLLCTLFGCVGVLQGIALLLKDERVVLVPPELKQQVWVEKGRASESYLEEMGLFFVHLALDVSPSSAAYQREVLLRYASPEQFSPLKRQLLEDEVRLKKENLSTTFRPSSVKVSRSEGQLEVTGDLIGTVGDQRVFQIRETYQVQLRFYKGRLFLSGLTCIRSDRP